MATRTARNRTWTSEKRARSSMVPRGVQEEFGPAGPVPLDVIVWSSDNDLFRGTATSSKDHGERRVGVKANNSVRSGLPWVMPTNPGGASRRLDGARWYFGKFAL
jgi:hypothetical protein